MEQAVERAVRGQSGRLRVGFTASATFNPVVPGAIRGFRRAYPQVQLVLQEANTMQLLEGLAQGRFDAIFLRPGVSDPEGVRQRVEGADRHAESRDDRGRSGGVKRLPGARGKVNQTRAFFLRTCARPRNFT